MDNAFRNIPILLPIPANILTGLFSWRSAPVFSIASSIVRPKPVMNFHTAFYT
jgi:hypothetical protein